MDFSGIIINWYKKNIKHEFEVVELEIIEGDEL
jgi:hypothetical protein